MQKATLDKVIPDFGFFSGILSSENVEGVAKKIFNMLAGREFVVVFVAEHKAYHPAVYINTRLVELAALSFGSFDKGFSLSLTNQSTIFSMQVPILPEELGSSYIDFIGQDALEITVNIKQEFDRKMSVWYYLPPKSYIIYIAALT